jgi:hypothetical protein
MPTSLRSTLSTILFAAATASALGAAAAGCTDEAADAPPAARAAALTATPSAPSHAVVSFGDLVAEDQARPAAAGAPVAHQHPRRPGAPVITSGPAAAALAQPAAPALPPSPAPSATFDAVDDDLSVFPPDTMGAVGPNHLLVSLNNKLQIQSRSGAVLGSVAWPTFWSRVFSGFTFDPRAAYDVASGRFIISMAGNEDATASILVAVSQTGDPTGAWNVYRVDADPQHLVWADYPRLGFNKSWIVVQANMYPVTGAAASPDAYGSHVWAFDKADLFAAGAGRHTAFVLPEISTVRFDIAPAATYDASLAVEYLLEAVPNDAPANPSLVVFQIAGAVGAETLTQVASSVAPLGWALGAGSDSAPQLGTSQPINVSDNGLLNVVERNGALWATEAVYPDTSSTRTAVQWLQMTPAGAIQQFGRLDDTTGAVHYGYPSLAVNAHGDVAVGFSRFSATQYASAAYAIHAAADPAGSLRPETVFKTGLASYIKIASPDGNRWGDYSATVIDPTNDAQFWTIQEYAATQTSGTSRWGTWWAELAIPSATAAVQINAGGPAVAPYAADTGFSGGSTINHADKIDLSGVTSPAPMAAYQTARIGTFSYTLGGFAAGSSHTVRLHFAETYFTKAGARVFNVSLNGASVLTSFDIYAAAGAKDKAVVRPFTAAANASGAYVIAFTRLVDNSLVSAIEIQ